MRLWRGSEEVRLEEEELVIGPTERGRARYWSNYERRSPRLVRLNDEEVVVISTSREGAGDSSN